ncbi:hypothetical protein K8Z61_18465 [Nocardioides sp. TRM66260-LWL]|uniref:hypothetical protein n=1 Tax=Nocardioides sp. TRM66260-LWL TaxID=2874478 RepID=UPI001CC36972|nr:hypothetical protein [Nocardioides sp. TRM66260-LWL]MBZ5736479.1 hypothetical protein [Nocardioides sp. TRM66260-LWL]
MTDVPNIADRRAAKAVEETTSEFLLCAACGSAWFTVQAVTLHRTGPVNCYAAPVACRECGTVAISGADLPKPIELAPDRP